MADTYQTKLTVNGRNPNDNTLEVYRSTGTDCTELAATYRNQYFWLPTGKNWMTRKWISGENQDDGFNQCVCVNATINCETLCANDSAPAVFSLTVSGISGTNNCPGVGGVTVDCNNFNREWRCTYESGCFWSDAFEEEVGGLQHRWTVEISVSEVGGLITVTMEFENLVSNLSCQNRVRYRYTTAEPIDCSSITLEQVVEDFGSGWPSSITLTGE